MGNEFNLGLQHSSNHKVESRAHAKPVGGWSLQSLVLLLDLLPDHEHGPVKEGFGDNTKFCLVLWSWCLEGGMANQSLAREMNSFAVFCVGKADLVDTLLQSRTYVKRSAIPFLTTFCASSN